MNTNETPRVVGICKYCQAELLLDPDWNAPIWANLYCNDPAGHEVGGVVNPKIERNCDCNEN